MSKTDLWDRLGKTDPAHTKSFKRQGGFSGTAIKPIWSYRRMTEEYGPCGVGWGIGAPSFQTVSAPEGEVLVFCTVGVWHGKPENIMYGVGGDKAVGKNKYGIVTDDEAFKKAFTDAVTNALKLIGVGADVHMGLFDDDKYVNNVKSEFAAERQNPHVTRPADVMPKIEYDERGQPIDNIPHPDPDAVKKLRVVDQRPIFEELQKEIWATGSVDALTAWAAANKNRLGALKDDWQEFLRGVYAEHLKFLRDGDQQDTVRMAG